MGIWQWFADPVQLHDGSHPLRPQAPISQPITAPQCSNVGNYRSACVTTSLSSLWMARSQLPLQSVMFFSLPFKVEQKSRNNTTTIVSMVVVLSCLESQVCQVSMSSCNEALLLFYLINLRIFTGKTWEMWTCSLLTINWRVNLTLTAHFHNKLPTLFIHIIYSPELNQPALIRHCYIPWCFIYLLINKMVVKARLKSQIKTKQKKNTQHIKCPANQTCTLLERFTI